MEEVDYQSVSQLASNQCQGKPGVNDADGLDKEDLACLTLFREPFGKPFNKVIKKKHLCNSPVLLLNNEIPVNIPHVSAGEMDR